ncbi:MAG TPA: aldehyde:ferredoxin oxidoreductase, partial [Eubacteriaceae bacterium]|nr:aldehyde:ferredoxin oxidoreductase [Eubacteriaceae bacterium]
GERVNNLAKVFNITAGLTKKDDTFPKRILTEPIKAGASKGHYVSQEELDMMLNEYYETRSWTTEGVPTAEKLAALNLNDAAEALKKKGLL